MEKKGEGRSHSHAILDELIYIKRIYKFVLNFICNYLNLFYY